jgi:hypothetical protein
MVLGFARHQEQTNDILPNKIVLCSTKFVRNSKPCRYGPLTAGRPADRCHVEQHSVFLAAIFTSLLITSFPARQATSSLLLPTFASVLIFRFPLFLLYVFYFLSYTTGIYKTKLFVNRSYITSEVRFQKFRPVAYQVILWSYLDLEIWESKRFVRWGVPGFHCFRSHIELCRSLSSPVYGLLIYITMFIESSDRLISEQWIGKDMEGSCCGFIWGRYYHRICLERLKKTTKILGLEA